MNGAIIPVNDTGKSVTVTMDTSVITQGSVTCYKKGNVCQFFLSNVKFSSSGTKNNFLTGLPKAKIQTNVYFSQGDNTAGWINADSTVMNITVNDATKYFWGGATYICED